MEANLSVAVAWCLIYAFRRETTQHFFLKLHEPLEFTGVVDRLFKKKRGGNVAH